MVPNVIMRHLHAGKGVEIGTEFIIFSGSGEGEAEKRNHRKKGKGTTMSVSGDKGSCFPLFATGKGEEKKKAGMRSFFQPSTCIGGEKDNSRQKKRKVLILPRWERRGGGGKPFHLIEQDSSYYMGARSTS